MSLSEKLEKRIGEIEAAAKSQLPAAADAFAQTLRDVLNDPGDKYRPSLPGEAPHRVTGKLVESIVVQTDTTQGVAGVGPTVPYAKHLLLSRPFYQLAIEKCRSKLVSILFKAKS